MSELPPPADTPPFPGQVARIRLLISESGCCGNDIVGSTGEACQGVFPDPADWCWPCRAEYLLATSAAAQGTARQLEQIQKAAKVLRLEDVIEHPGDSEMIQLLRNFELVAAAQLKARQSEAAYAALREATQALVTAVQNWDAHATNCRVKDCLRCQTNHFEMIAAASRVVQP